MLKLSNNSVSNRILNTNFNGQIHWEKKRTTENHTVISTDRYVWGGGGRKSMWNHTIASTDHCWPDASVTEETQDVDVNRCIPQLSVNNSISMKPYSKTIFQRTDLFKKRAIGNHASQFNGPILTRCFNNTSPLRRRQRILSSHRIEIQWTQHRTWTSDVPRAHVRRIKVQQSWVKTTNGIYQFKTPLQKFKPGSQKYNFDVDNGSETKSAKELQ